MFFFCIFKTVSNLHQQTYRLELNRTVQMILLYHVQLLRYSGVGRLSHVLQSVKSFAGPSSTSRESAYRVLLSTSNNILLFHYVKNSDLRTTIFMGLR